MVGAFTDSINLEFVSFVNDENGAPIYENTIVYAILKKEWEAKKC